MNAHAARAIALCLALASLSPALAGEASVTILDAYARSASPAAPTGAAYIDIASTATRGDTLLAVESPAAKRVELHTSAKDSTGMTMMQHMSDGIDLPAQGVIDMGRGGIHVMLMGLTEPLKHGASIQVVLHFREAGTVEIEVPVDLERTEDADASASQGAMDHGTMTHGN